MKAIFAFFVFFFSITATVIAQERSRSSVGLVYSFPIITSRSFPPYYGVGATYLFSINKRFTLETGLEYNHFQYSGTGRQHFPPFEAYPIDVRASILTVPVLIRVNLLKYFFVNAGALVDFDLGGKALGDSPFRRNGVGIFLLGIGAFYNFKNGLSFFVNVPFEVHNEFFSTSDDRHPLKLGFRLGATYAFKSRKK